MSDVLAGALSLLLSTNKGTALTNLVAEQTGVIASVAATNDPVALEFQGLLRADDEVSEEVQRWLDALPDGAAVSPELKARIDSRHDGMTRRYEDFLRRHPRHAPAMVAFGSYLGDIGDEIGMAEQWEKAREINPSDPAVWNNLAGHYAHRGPIEKAFPYIEKAIELNPKEAQYWHSAGTLTFLFRRDAEKYYHLDEQGVFRKAFEFYDKAMALQPLSFKLAADVAQTWYGVKAAPGETEDLRKAGESRLVESGMRAWTNAYRLAGTDVEREGVRLHFARWQIRAARWTEARTNLDLVSDSSLNDLKSRLERNWKEKQNPVPESEKSTK
jgi:tetratricopeptide (TPR) repeat protein